MSQNMHASPKANTDSCVQFAKLMGRFQEFRRFRKQREEIEVSDQRSVLKLGVDWTYISCFPGFAAVAAGLLPPLLLEADG